MRKQTAGRTKRIVSSLLTAVTVLGIAAGSRPEAIAQPLTEAAPNAKQIIGATSSTLKEIRVIYTYEYTTAGSALVARAAAIYKDGTFTRDFSGVEEHGVAGSQQRNPRLWGTWRINNEGKFEYRYTQSTDWRVPIASTPSINNEFTEVQLQGCYTSQYSVAVSGASSLSFNTLCFDETGAFSNRRIRSASSGDGTAGSDSRRVGRYLAIGNIIGTGFERGSEIFQTLGVYGNNTETAAQISVNGTVFNRNDD